MFITQLVNCLEQPMIFYLKDGGLLQANSFKHIPHRSTHFFQVKQMNKAKNCMTLMLLRPCTLCCGQDVLVPMDECITIDVSCLCGYQTISNICIRACHHVPICTRDCVCGLFSIPVGVNEITIWQSNVSFPQYGCLNITFESEHKPPVKLSICTNGSTGNKIYQLTNQTSYHFHVTNDSIIKIITPTLDAKVKGAFDIQWKSVIS